ncbi:MAG: hypothetical protein IH989_06425 [Planctomycetes bacterium]|nr:hypothetical protein [Planctomycetota bacterium]
MFQSRSTISACGSSSSFDVRVLELHDANSDGVASVKIDLHTGGIPIERVERYFDQENRIATHTFRFAKSDRESLLSSSEAAVQFTRRTDLQSNSWHIKSESVVVRIVSDTDLFPLEATSSFGTIHDPQELPQPANSEPESR